MTEPLTIEAFADWCAKQPADATYNWVDTAECACAQYADAIGDRGAGGKFWQEAQAIALGDDHPHEWTFGKLTHRLRAA